MQSEKYPMVRLGTGKLSFFEKFTIVSSANAITNIRLFTYFSLRHFLYIIILLHNDADVFICNSKKAYANIP